MSENKAPAAQLNCAGTVSALLGRLDLNARHLPHDLRAATLRTLEALCSLTLIFTDGRAEHKAFPTFLAEKLIDRHVVSPPACAILPRVPEHPCLLKSLRVGRWLLLICSGASNQSCEGDGRRTAAARQRLSAGFLSTSTSITPCTTPGTYAGLERPCQPEGIGRLTGRGGASPPTRKPTAEAS
jgi:hypothetical protein